ncbi:Heterokaryon incompatibility protein (HET) domain containing protein [Naviculisporaceae sp. PSN 640]
MDPIHFQTHSCDNCQKLVFDLCEDYVQSAKRVIELAEQIDNGTFPKPREDTPEEEHEDMSRKGVLFSITLDQLWAAADGCKFFNTLLDDEWISRDAIHSNARKDLPIDDPTVKLGWAFRDSSLWLEEWQGEPVPENTLRNLCPGRRDALKECRLWASQYQSMGNPLDIEIVRFFGLWDPETKKILYRTRHGFHVFTHSSDPAAEVISTRPIVRFPGSSTSLLQVASWLHACQQNHSCKTMPGPMPNRLVQVMGTSGDDIVLRLCDMAKDKPIAYAALSYCWGGEQPMKTLRSNIDSYRTSGIPFHEQPQTIKDAAKVCLEASIRYLWVDALCIVQDDDDEKEDEIARMPSIYGGAAVTLIVARAASVSDGFLGERIPDSYEATTLPYRCLGGELGSITLVQLGGELESQVAPIDERGWTLQERLLSSRIVEFGSWQTRWICPHTRSDSADTGSNSGEGFTDGWRRDTPWGSTRKVEALDLTTIRTIKDTVDFYGQPRPSKFKELYKAMEHWASICSSFTQRKLTIPTDRALAISGLAQVFAQHSRDQYLAGLWKSCFHSGLLWRVDNNITNSRAIVRPTAYQGPSWSWVSVNGPVSFERPGSRSSCAAEILACEVKPAKPSAPYGLVAQGSGRLVLSARTAYGMRYRVELRSPGRFKHKLMIISAGDTRLSRVPCYATAETCLDVEDEEKDELEQSAGCLAVEICRTGGDSRGGEENISVRGLLLKWSSPERKTYRRIGWFSYYGKRKGTPFKFEDPVPLHVRGSNPEEGELVDCAYLRGSDLFLRRYVPQIRTHFSQLA